MRPGTHHTAWFRDTRAESLAIPAALAILTAAVWSSSVFNGFVFDDLVNIGANPWIKDWSRLPQAFTHHAAGFDPRFDTSFYRPLMHVCYAIAYAMAGPQPWAFHSLNVILHVIAVLCVYLLTSALLNRWSDPERYAHLPTVAAVVFSVHPVHTEAVAWIAGITDLSYTVFGLAALLAYVRALTRRTWSWISALLLLASMLAKEPGVAVLFLMAVFELVEARNRSDWSIREAAARLAPAVGTLGIYIGMRLWALGSFAPSAGQHPYGFAELVATGGVLLATYLSVLVLPLELNAMRPLHGPLTFDQPLALTGVILALALPVLSWRARKDRMMMLPVGVVLLPLLPSLYAPAIESGGSVFGERYLYLPVLGLAWCLGFAVEEARHRVPAARVWRQAAILALVVLSSAAVVERNRVWADSLTLWSDVAEKSPDMPAAHEGLCFGLYGANRFAEAVAACNRAIALDPKRIDARLNRAAALLALGRAHDALAETDVVLAMRAASPEALVYRGLACMMLGRPDEAVVSYRRALDLSPTFAEAHNDLGVALVQLGRAGEGRRHLEQAVLFAPDHPEYRANLEACPTQDPSR